MATVMFACGCSVSRSMFGTRDVTSVYHCEDHWGLYSQDKTNRQMADEIIVADHTRREMPEPDYGEGAHA